MEFAEDKIIVLRKPFCHIAEKLIVSLLTKDEQEERYKLVEALDNLKTGLDQDIADLAFDCEERALSDYKETVNEYK